MSSDPYSPRSFLRERRPYLFSDTFATQEPVLDRAVLEYHLESLTSRSQEYDFQEFARRLAEAEICPNLLPQTGPTGGGDSQVDTETVPVADSLSLAWYSGIGREGASERWAFAMTTKREWRSKLREDIAKIAATQRGYEKAFFITSQYVRDRDRAKLEDELSTKHGMDVRILDRSWILDRVFTNRHELLAIESLKLEVSKRQAVQQGPLDVQREQDLAEIDSRIDEFTRNEQFVPSLVDDCLQSATLARGLERPRTEVDGRFMRAERMAEKCGTPHQQLLVAYQWAWTAYFWYEDYLFFARLYQVCESLAEGSTNPHELQLLTNLWQILLPLVGSHQLDAATIDFDAHTSKLTAELNRLAQDEGRASASLQAQSSHLTMQLLLVPPDDRESIFGELKVVVEQSQHLIGFPLKPLVESLLVIGDAFAESEAYQDLFDFLVETTATREGETAAARLLLRRGEQQINANRPSEAIRTTGRGLAKLFKHESRLELVVALYLMSVSYERLGLLWAARGMLLAAASIAAQELRVHGELTMSQAACFNRLKWLELQLGRVTQVLAWHEVDVVTRHALRMQGRNLTTLEEGEEHFDAILGILLLRCRLPQLQQLGRLPHALENHELYAAAAALTFALGHEETLPAELGVDLSDPAALRAFFLRWRDQPAAKDLHREPSFGDSPEVTLTSTVLGCSLVVKAENSPACVALAESILAATESLLATGVVDRLIALEPSLSIEIRSEIREEPLFDFMLTDQGGLPHVQATCSPFDPNHLPADAQQQIKSKLVELLASILARVVPASNVEEFAAKLFGEDRALERSVNFACSFVVVGNVLGDSPRTDLASWLGPASEELPLVRTVEWDFEPDAPSRAADIQPSPRPTFGSGPPPDELLDASSTKHSEVRTVSLIRSSLWEQANWTGTGFLRTGRPMDPPMMALIFENEAAAVEIFTHLQEEVGDRDVDDRIRVTIIRGIDANDPNAYRVLIGTNLSAVPEEGLRYVAVGCRVNTMTPSSSENLDAFLDNYRTSGTYALGYAVGDGDSCTPRFQLVIGKHELNVRQAWEVGRHDFDSAGIREDDVPHIPSDQPNAPVIELLEWKQQSARDR